MTELEKQAFISNLWQAARTRASAMGQAVRNRAAGLGTSMRSAGEAISQHGATTKARLASAARNQAANARSFANATRNQAHDAYAGVRGLRANPKGSLGQLSRNDLVRGAASVGAGIAAGKMSDSKGVGVSTGLLTNAGLTALGRRF